jgi:hypothetical protein
VVAQERNEKLGTSVLENESEIAVTAAFEKLVAQLADPKAAVHVGLAKNFKQIAKSEKTFDPFVLWQRAEASDDDRIDGEKFTQAAS